VINDSRLGIGRARNANIVFAHRGLGLERIDLVGGQTVRDVELLVPVQIMENHPINYSRGINPPGVTDLRI
jgi:hypothetical protein